MKYPNNNDLNIINKEYINKEYGSISIDHNKYSIYQYQNNKNKLKSIYRS